MKNNIFPKEHLETSKNVTVLPKELLFFEVSSIVLPKVKSTKVFMLQNLITITFKQDMFCRVFILFISTSASTNTRNFNRYSARDIDK